MIGKSSHAVLCLFYAALLGAIGVLPAAAQSVEVKSGGERVTVEGDTVRIQGPGGETVVDADWRRTGAVKVSTDTEQILVDLGAVTVDDRIQLNLPGDVLFDFDSAAIRPDAAATLSKVAQVIRAKSVGEVYVLGHTDSLGDAAYNRTLSRQRAASVMGWLKRNEGIPANVMVGVGMGAAKPVAHNTNPDGSDSPQGRAQNRRVEFQMATRGGVQIGPDVIIAPGGVQISGSKVSVAGSAVEVDPSGVRVGDVEVTPGGVRIGGQPRVRVSGETAPAAPAARGGSEFSCLGGGCQMRCEPGSECDTTCIGGDCEMVCAPGAVCDFSCSGGDCRMRCESGSECDVSCSGGSCRMECAPGADCDFSCSGGDCTYQCAVGSDCDQSCTGGGCTCDGEGC